MRITKKQSLIVALVFLMLFFIFATTLTKRIRPKSEDTDLEYATTLTPLIFTAGTATDTDTKSKVVLNEFSRSEIRDGKKMWEVRAKHGQYFPENNTAWLHQAKLRLFRANGEEIILNAKYAKLFFADSSLGRADLSGGLTLNYRAAFTLKTASASYSKETNSVHAPGLVRIKHSHGKIIGEDMHVDLTQGEMTLKRNVDSVLYTRPRP